jgi:hypothetical protein
MMASTLGLVVTAALLSAPPSKEDPGVRDDNASSAGASWVFETELLAGYGAAWRGDESANAFELERAELGVGFDWRRHVMAELRLDAVRSVSGQSQFGVDGNALLVRLKRAWFGGGGTIGAFDIQAGAGLIAHPFLTTVERGHPLRGGSPTQFERSSFLRTADLGAFLKLAGWRGALELGVAVMNGEGYSDVELNDEKDLLVWLGSEPWQGPLFESPASVWLGVAFQDGSIGAGSAANRRLLAGATFASSRISTGFEFAYAFGYAGEGGRDASGTGAWVSGEPVANWLGLYARYDHLNDDIDADDAVRHRVALGLYSDVLSGLGGELGHGRIWLRYAHERSGEDRGPVPGIPDASAVHAFSVLVDLDAMYRVATGAP